MTEHDLERIRAVAEPLFAEAVAQGMHTTFSLNADSWGREYTEKLLSALGEDPYAS